jgi:hypothetical protein
LAEEKGYEGSFLPALGADILMIVVGYLAEFNILDSGDEEKNKTKSNILYGIGLVALGIIFYYVNQWTTFLKDKDVDTENLEFFFYIGWTLYGINFITPSVEVRQTAFNFLDLFNKAIYSFQLNSVIEKNF